MTGKQAKDSCRSFHRLMPQVKQAPLGLTVTSRRSSSHTFRPGDQRPRCLVTGVANTTCSACRKLAVGCAIATHQVRVYGLYGCQLLGYRRHTNHQSLKARSERWIERKACKRGHGQAGGDDAEIFVHAHEPARLECYCRVACFKQLVPSRRGHEKAPVGKGHLAILEQVVESGQHVAFGLFHAVQDKQPTAESRAHGRRVDVVDTAICGTRDTHCWSMRVRVQLLTCVPVSVSILETSRRCLSSASVVSEDKAKYSISRLASDAHHRARLRRWLPGGPVRRQSC